MMSKGLATRGTTRSIHTSDTIPLHLDPGSRRPVAGNTVHSNPSTGSIDASQITPLLLLPVVEDTDGDVSDVVDDIVVDIVDPASSKESMRFLTNMLG